LISNKPDILTIVSPYVVLRRAGQNFKGLCPFHSEKTPSFIVSPLRQSAHCFGCGWHGDVVKFKMDIERISFKEALIHLGINGKYKPPKLQEMRKRELVREFRAWCMDYLSDLCSLFITLQKAKSLCKTEEDVNRLALFYHKEPLLIYRIDILQIGTDAEQFDLYREVRNEF
jgi:hypothetical protein